jgi:hypothetical protein
VGEAISTRNTALPTRASAVIEARWGIVEGCTGPTVCASLSVQMGTGLGRRIGRAHTYKPHRDREVATVIRFSVFTKPTALALLDRTSDTRT